jgi:hypothetical protein
MAKHTIEIEIEPGGILKSEVHGISGSGCSGECNWLSKLGITKERKFTKDSYKTEKPEVKRSITS